MRLSRLRVKNFRGTQDASFILPKNCAFIGPNGCGKSTLIDALSLVLGRTKMVRPLTELDFFRGDPLPADRITIVATVTDFAGNDPARHFDWFRSGRAIPKWTDEAGTVYSTNNGNLQLCAQIGFAARFDHDELTVETVRYFHDDDTPFDPCDSEVTIEQVPPRLLNELGFFLLPARRTWEGMASFNSELFRRVVTGAEGIPATEILSQREHVRVPEHPIEKSSQLSSLVANIDEELGHLLIHHPEFKLRLTAGDCEAVLQALLPHYRSDGVTLPASRQGSGLLSLQTLLLLLEVGRVRKARGLPFILALEEPELHLSPGIQSRVVSKAMRLADQTICTTHSPQVASLHDATDTYIMTGQKPTCSPRPFLAKPLEKTATSTERKFFIQGRARVVEAIMHPFVLVPEGRMDLEWMNRLAVVGEPSQQLAPFTSIFGLSPTEDAAIVFTANTLCGLRSNIIALVDGDSAGDRYVKELDKIDASLAAIFQWPRLWTIEDIVVWILSAEAQTLEEVQRACGDDWRVESLGDLAKHLKTKNDHRNSIRGLKEDVIMHDALIEVMRSFESCVDRTALVLDALVAVADGQQCTRFTHPEDKPARLFEFNAS